MAMICVPWMLIPKPIILIARLPAKKPEALDGEEGDDAVEMISRERDRDQE